MKYWWNKWVSKPKCFKKWKQTQAILVLNFPVDDGILDRIRLYYRLVVPMASSNKSFCSKDSKGDHADDRGNQKVSENPMHIEFWGFKIAKIYMNYFLLQIHLTNVRKQGLSKETGFHNLTTTCSTRGGSL